MCCPHCVRHAWRYLSNLRPSPGASLDLESRTARRTEFRLLGVDRRDCTVYTIGNTSLYPMSFKFENGIVVSQLESPISDLLGTMAKWDNSGIRVITVIQTESGQWCWRKTDGSAQRGMKLSLIFTCQSPSGAGWMLIARLVVALVANNAIIYFSLHFTFVPTAWVLPGSDYPSASMRVTEPLSIWAASVHIFHRSHRRF